MMGFIIWDWFERKDAQVWSELWRMVDWKKGESGRGETASLCRKPWKDEGARCLSQAQVTPWKCQKMPDESNGGAWEQPITSLDATWKTPKLIYHWIWPTNRLLLTLLRFHDLPLFYIFSYIFLHLPISIKSPLSKWWRYVAYRQKRGWDLKMETLVTRKYRVRGCTRQLLRSPGYPVPASKLSIKVGSGFTAVFSFFLIVQ